MPDLHAINIHLQERLEREWRDEVRAPEAAAWLDRAGLLRNDRNGLPLRRLLRAGRIAGQEQRPDRKNGAWWIRRIAETPDRDGIFRARQRMRDYLPFERGHLHADCQSALKIDPLSACKIDPPERHGGGCPGSQ